MATYPTTVGSDFLDDFYAECDQHLVEIRRALLQLEQQVGEITPESSVLEKIFRGLHSVKGICGMAGLQSAERLAHAAEDYLRALTRHELSLTPEGLETLTNVAQNLEQLVVNHRQGKAEFDIRALLKQAAELLPRGSGEAQPEFRTSEQLSEETAGLIQAAEQKGRKVLRCVFQPSPELDRKGVNVNSIRVQLQTLGEILQAVPKVQGSGKLSFEFIVAAEKTKREPLGWETQGIKISPLRELDDTREHEAPAPPKVVPPAVASSPFIAPSQFIRVDLGRLDDLMRIMGDIVVRQARLEEALARVTSGVSTVEGRNLQEVRQGLNRDLRHMRDGITRLRLVPIGELFDRLPFVVRDLSRENGKKARLVIMGARTELDKFLVERMKDPLLHLVRNAICHGIEDPAERLANAKEAEGTVTVQAYTKSETVIIEVIDDGRGIDRQRLAAKARSENLVLPENATDPEVLDLLCTPGFSTREIADFGAGRGMGMAAVKTTITDLSGELELETQGTSGCTFRLRLPLTLAVADALIISAGGQRFAMPHSVVQEITTAESSSIKRLEQNEIMPHRNGVLPLISLSNVFGLTAEQRKSRPVLVIGTGLSAIGIVADRVLGHREIVVRPIKDPLLKVSGISGATELGDGRPVLILDSAALTHSTRKRQTLGKKASAIATPS